MYERIEKCEVNRKDWKFRRLSLCRLREKDASTWKTLMFNQLLMSELCMICLGRNWETWRKLSSNGGKSWEWLAVDVSQDYCHCAERSAWWMILMELKLDGFELLPI